MKKLLYLFIYFLDVIFVKKHKQIVYTSFPDFSDNSFSLFVYVANNHTDYKNIWLVDDIKKSDDYQRISASYTANKNYKIIKKNSILGVFYYVTSKYVFFTHGLFSGIKIPKHHCVVNLWHGMPLKKIGYLMPVKSIDNIQTSKYLTVTSSLFQDLFCRAFQIVPENILITGQPRNDLLFKKIGALKSIGITNKYKNIFIWMPTYRKSIKGEIREDGEFIDGRLPVITFDNLLEINELLENLNSFLIIKLHPMDALTLKVFKKYSHIKIINNVDLEKANIQLYSLLSEVDVLLTDYSSVYIDFMLTMKAIAFITSDIDKYINTRGLVFEKPKDYMPGAIITNKTEFVQFLRAPVVSHNYAAVNTLFNVKHQSYSREVLVKLGMIS